MVAERRRRDRTHQGGDTVNWIKSSKCDSSACVFVWFAGGKVFVRGSGDGPVLTFTRNEWAAFIAGAQDGEFDLEEVNP